MYFIRLAAINSKEQNLCLYYNHILYARSENFFTEISYSDSAERLRNNRWMCLHLSVISGLSDKNLEDRPELVTKAQNFQKHH